VTTTLERIKQWLGRAVGSADDVVEEGTPAATPPPGAGPVARGDERETSTNAQTEGAADEPWPGNA
jgi:hypothetical protein